MTATITITGTIDHVRQLLSNLRAPDASPASLAFQFMTDPVATAAVADTRVVCLDGDGRECTPGQHVSVVDRRTGLQWAVAYASDERVTWKRADALARAVTLHGHSDWRLPTRSELLSLVDDTRHDPAIDVSLFPGTKLDWHWTSSPAAWAPERDAWLVYFDDGGAGAVGRGLHAFVRAVRSASAPGQ